MQVLVGEAAEVFHVHENVLVNSSDFFKKAIHGEFKENEGIVRLPTQDPEVFKVYTQWLYRRTIGLAVAAKGHEDKEELKMKLVVGWAVLVELYVLGDMLLDEEVCNAAMDAILHIMDVEKCCPTGLASRVEAKLSNTSPLYRLVVDIWTASGPNVYAKVNGRRPVDIDEGSKDFWVDVARSLAQRCGGGFVRPTLKNRCAYHIHSKSEKCKPDSD